MSAKNVYLSIAFIVVAIPAAAQDVRFNGSVNVVVDRDDMDRPLPEENVSYPPAPNTAIRILRQSELKNVNSDGNGEYRLTVSPGPPVLVLYDGGGQLKPELKMLTADPVKPQTIHVTLLTYRQFAERFGRQALIDEVERILRLLRKHEGFDTGDLEKRIQEFADIRVE